MSEYAVEGQKLKKMVKLARKSPLPFAFNPGKSEKEHLLAMHRKRTPAILGKAAKKDGPGVKVAFGMAEVRSKEFRLTCERTVPAMARHLKRFLKANKVQLNVVVLDAEGNTLEEAIEDLPDDPGLAVNKGQKSPPKTGQKLQLQDESKDIIADIQRLKPLIGRNEPQVQAQLNAVVARIVALLKASEIEDARNLLARLQTQVSKLSKQTRQAPDPTPDISTQTERLRSLSARARKTQMAINAAPDSARKKLLAVFQAAITALKDGRLNKSAELLDKLETALEKLSSKKRSAKISKDGATPKKPVSHQNTPRPSKKHG